MATTMPRLSVKPHQALHITLWVAQCLLALMFLYTGFTKAFTPWDALARTMGIFSDMPHWLPRFIGLCELAGGVGLLLPALTRIKPMLTAWAAAGLCTIMILACAFHLVRGEINHLALPIILGALAAFVAVGRFNVVPILPRYDKQRGL